MDIFFSYTHVDRERVRPLVELLEAEGWTVWWDRGIVPGAPWLPELDTEIAKARALLVVWSKTSVKSQWVHHEARRGLEKGALVPVMLDIAKPPKAFAAVQAMDLSRWEANKQKTETEALLRRLAALVPPSRIDTVRPGYDPLFLDLKRPLTFPGVTGPVAVLRYLHFTVVMNPARRIAHYVAYNCDGAQFASVSRRTGDVWSADPLLPKSLQMNAQLLRHNPYDRGHLVARATVCWGNSRIASIASRQVFYFPNVAPQHYMLNQGSWLDLEKWEREQACTRGRLIGFSGPVFSANDEPLSGDLTFEQGLVARDTFRVPLEYWKVCIVRATRKKFAVASFLVRQEAFMERLLSSPKHPRMPPALRSGTRTAVDRFRVPLKYIEQVAHVRFPEILHTASPLS